MYSKIKNELERVEMFSDIFLRSYIMNRQISF